MKYFWQADKYPPKAMFFSSSWTQSEAMFPTLPAVSENYVTEF